MSFILQHPLITLTVFFSVTLLVWEAAKYIQAFMEEYEKKYVSDVAQVLNEMFIFQDAQKLFILNIVIVVVFFFVTLLFTRNIIYLLIAAGVGFALPKIYMWWARRKRLQRFEEQLVDGLAILSNSLRAGLTLTQSIEVLEREAEPPISQEFGLGAGENPLGVNLGDALENLNKRMPCEDLDILVTAIGIVYSMGGNLMEIFDSIAYVIRERTKLKGKTDALTSQG